MFTVILTLLIGVYLLIIPFRTGLLGWHKTGIGEKGTQLLRKAHLFLLGLLLLLWVLATKEIYLRGYWTTKILFWCFFFSGIMLFAFGKKQISRKIERVYYSFYFWLPIGIAPLMVIPYIGGYLLITISFLTLGDNYDILYSDSKYRIQKTHEFSPATALFVKRGLFEFKQKPEIISNNFILDVGSISIQEISSDSVKILVYFKGSFFTNNPYVLKIKLEN